MTTLKELSKHLGLSVTQVSRALNDHDDVSKATKKRVREAAKSLNYEPNLAARRLVSGRSGIVGLVFPHMPEPSDAWYFTQFVAGLSSAFSEQGKQFMLNIPKSREDGLAVHDQLIRSRSIDGFVVIIPTVDDARVKFLREKEIPFVLHGQTMDEPDYPFYDIDNVAVGYDLTRHLIEAGHREIAFINGEAQASFVQRRFIGHARALSEAGLPVREQFRVSGVMTEELGLLETIRMFHEEGPSPTGIVASNMRIVKGIFSAAKALGLSVPADISVVAHDDLLPDCPPEDFPVAVTRTYAPLEQSWQPLALFLSDTLRGAPLEEVQKIEPHVFIKGASVRVLSGS